MMQVPAPASDRRPFHLEPAPSHLIEAACDGRSERGGGVRDVSMGREVLAQSLTKICMAFGHRYAALYHLHGLYGLPQLAEWLRTIRVEY